MAFITSVHGIDVGYTKRAVFRETGSVFEVHHPPVNGKPGPKRVCSTLTPRPLILVARSRRLHPSFENAAYD